MGKRKITKDQKVNYKDLNPPLPPGLLGKKKDKDLHRVLEGKDREDRRKKRGEVTLEDKLLLIHDYSKGVPMATLRSKYHYNSKEILKIINTHMANLSNIRESRVLEDKHSNKSAFNAVLQKLKDLSHINEDFLSLLSTEDSTTLSDNEVLFSQLYVNTGDSEESIISSGLDVGLIKKDDRGPLPSYRTGILIRSTYLRNKPNISQYITLLREESDNTKDVDKTYIQSLLMEEIRTMKERGSKRDKVNLRQTIELLGKTIGAFTERVEVHEIDPSKSLDLLIEMAQDAEVKELTHE